MPDALEDPEDPFLAAEIERALAPYQAMLSPELLAHYRELLEDVLTTHPTARRLLDRARPRRPQEKSGEIAKGGGPATAPGREGKLRGGRR